MTTQPAVSLSELTPEQTIYPFAEKFVKDTSGTDSVDLWKIPAGTIITMVLARVKVAGTGTGANIIVGDDDDDNGYILAASICGTTVGTIYGDAVAERGAYLTNAGGAVESHAGKWKVYTAEGKELKMDCSAALTTEATMEVFVFGYRYSA